jgi:glucose/arabinose dehydrogenase
MGGLMTGPLLPGLVLLGALLLGWSSPDAFAASFSLRFHGNGVNGIDRVKIPLDAPARPVDVGRDFTVEFWMKGLAAENGSGDCVPGPDNWITGNVIFDRDVSGPGDFGDWGIAVFGNQGGRLAFGVARGTTGAGICGATPVLDGLWHHIAVTRSRRGELRIYVDGVLDAVGTGPRRNVSYRDGRVGAANDPFLVIGAEKHDSGPGFPSFSGWLDEIRVSNVVRYLSGFTRPSSPFTSDGNTVALYHLDEGSGDTIGDSAGSRGGPSTGTRMFGGSPAGPEWSTDVAPLGGLPAIALQPIAANLTSPVAIAHAKDARLFIVLQGGRIVVHDGTQVLATPFLDITSIVLSGGEQGLLGLAFHPDYGQNGFFFVYYTSRTEGAIAAGTIVIARYSVSGDPATSNVANPASRQILLTIPHPTYTNHNGGAIGFGFDGYLYAGVGDGGGGGDPSNNAQNLGVLLGKILRLDVGSVPAASPPDNPFQGVPGARPEIWALGLRNPWRITFDRRTGDLFVADVGQGLREEINVESPSLGGGLNYCWRSLEGTLVYDPGTACTQGTPTGPILEYGHVDGHCSVTGGYRYRGTQIPGLHAVYLYGDYCSGVIWGGSQDGNGAWTASQLLDTSLGISSFGEDSQGELYVVHLGGGAPGQGTVYRVVAGP